MKILIVNENLIEGGTEQSCLKMKKLLEEKNNEVMYLTFDKEFDKKVNELDKNVNRDNILNLKIKNNKLNKLIFNWGDYRKIRKIINQYNPNKIILNNIYSTPITQIKALKGYDVYQIIRDYSVICPKQTCIKPDYQVCKGYKFDKCNNCKYHESKLQMLIKLRLIKKLEKIRKKVVKAVISPSECLNEYLINYGYASYCINNPMDISASMVKKTKIRDKSIKKYLYIGAINKNKGIYNFIEAFNKFSKEKSVELIIVGKCSSNQDNQILNKYIMMNDKIKYLGYKRHANVIEEIEKSDFTVVPSLWMENYPTTVLEGMLYESLVLGSNRGGIPKMLSDNKGMLFDITNGKNVIEILQKSYKMSEKEYNDITNKARCYVIKNNSYDKYYKEIMEVLKK